MDLITLALAKKRIAANAGDIAQLKEDLTVVSAKVSAIEEAEGLHKYGVSGIGQSASALTRIWDSVGMTAQVGTDGDNSNVVNNFDDVTPFNRRKSTSRTGSLECPRITTRAGDHSISSAATTTKRTRSNMHIFLHTRSLLMLMAMPYLSRGSIMRRETTHNSSIWRGHIRAAPLEVLLSSSLRRSTSMSGLCSLWSLHSRTARP